MPTAPRLVQLHLHNGRASETGPYIAASSDAPGTPAPFTYVILIEPLRNQDESVCPAALSTLLQHLQERRGGVTRALELGAQEVHRQLRGDRPEMAPPGSGVGIACAALRGQELYLGLAGPTVAFLLHPGGFEILSADSPAGSPAGRGLGVGRNGALRLYRRELAPAAVVLLASSLARSAVPAGALAEVAAEGAEAVLVQVYRRVADAPAFAAAALSLNDAAHAASTPGAALAVNETKTNAPAGITLAEADPALSARGAPVPAPQRPAESLGLELRSPRRIASSRGLNLSIPPFVVAIVLAALAVLSMATMLWYLQAQAATSREARYAALQLEASFLYDQASTAVSRDAMRQKLFQARDAVDAADGIQPGVLETAALRGQIEDRLAELTAARPLGEPKALIDFRLNATASALRDPVLAGAGLGLADYGANRIYLLPPGDPTWRPESPPALGLSRDTGPRTVRRMLWMPRGGLWLQDALLAFDEGRTLWEYRIRNTPAGASPTPLPSSFLGDGEWRAVPLRGAPGWESFEGAQGFNGNLYVLDPAASQVWRYVATDTGFDSERTGALTAGSDLREAVDFALDGDVYVLLRSGRVLKFSGGRSQVFPMDGLDRRLSGPAALFTGPDAQRIYVADNGNRRVVMFDKSGVFQQQLLLPDSLPPVTDLLADEGRRVLYLVCGRLLVVSTLPE